MEDRTVINGSRKVSERVAEKTGLEVAAISIFQTHFFKAVYEEVLENGVCNIPHFGTFKLGRIKEKTIKNTLGGDVKIKDWKVFKFLPAYELKKDLNKNNGK
jgi:nucleoid DNA-binding protein